jgi:hypothetical protein
MSDKLERIWKEADAAISAFAGGAEEKQENLQS